MDPGVKINSQYYVNHILEEGLWPWAQHVFGDRNWTFTQDGAPSHTSRVTQSWLKARNPGFLDKTLWPPSSPDVNPLDFSLWSILEDKACKKTWKNLDELKRALTLAWDEIPMETVRAAVEAVPKRLRQIIKEKGGHIEK